MTLPRLVKLSTSCFSVRSEISSLYLKAAEHIYESDGLYITAGAGIGVDSGLPDFRGNTGFWKAYPPMEKLSIGFTDMANPIWFSNNPKLAWGFYGHRMKLYHNTIPHEGFHLLRKMSAHNSSEGYFIFTSNVDEQFQKSGYKKERILECHGSIFNLQCVYDYCSVCESKFDHGIASIDEICKINDISIKEWMKKLQINENTFEIIDNELLPKCLLQQIQCKCPYMKNKNQRNTISEWIWNKKNISNASDSENAIDIECISRPNILMFGDSGFKTGNLMKQYERIDDWKKGIALKGKKLCVIEIGAGSTVARVRLESESAASSSIVDTFIRINPTESQISKFIKCKNKISISANALVAIQSIYECWESL